MKIKKILRSGQRNLNNNLPYHTMMKPKRGGTSLLGSQPWLTYPVTIQELPTDKHHKVMKKLNGIL